jgi:hypothetical protein
VSQGGCTLPAQGTLSGWWRCSLLLTSLSDPVPFLHLLAYSPDIPWYGPFSRFPTQFHFNLSA